MFLLQSKFSEKVCVDSGRVMDHHFHFKVVDFLAHLLGQERVQAVASRNLRSAVIVLAVVGVVNNDARRESDRPTAASGQSRRDTGVTAVVVHRVAARLAWVHVSVALLGQALVTLRGFET